MVTVKTRNDQACSLFYLLCSQERIEKLIPLFFLFTVLNIKLSKYASPIS